ncbi:MAG: ferritin-like domain-containing protein [Rhodospirillales bacterium]|nr:ferritin-like domain-containing protein [Alphaproteobacteria bacterium]MBL6948602.1 ferritin-like domain-containing protein [Rhodospirillales bacterium]
MTALPESLSEAARAVISEPEPVAKVALTRRFADAWDNGNIAVTGHTPMPDRPARPAAPELRPPRDMPKRNPRGEAGRIAFLHAIAHIELNAIDLAWDILGRFTVEEMPKAFFDDWVAVALDEAEHFDLLARRLEALGAAYGDHPAHDGLWEAAEITADDLAARLALVPMVLEARGLDTTPKAVRQLRDSGDGASADVLETIATEEIPHVAAGVRWFEFLCDKRGLEPVAEFHRLVGERFRGSLKAPFNEAARAEAGFSHHYYRPLASSHSGKS